VASVFGPIGYPPQPVLVFHHQQLQGVGIGSIFLSVLVRDCVYYGPYTAAV